MGGTGSWVGYFWGFSRVPGGVRAQRDEKFSVGHLSAGLGNNMEMGSNNNLQIADFPKIQNIVQYSTVKLGQNDLIFGTPANIGSGNSNMTFRVYF